MAYLFKQKLILPSTTPASLVFVVEPEEYLLDLYCKYLMAETFMVKGFRTLEDIDTSRTLSPDVVILNTALLRQPDFPKFKADFLPAPVKIISIGIIEDQNIVSKLMSLGVAGHLERRLSRLQDLVEVVKAVIYH